MTPTPHVPSGGVVPSVGISHRRVLLIAVPIMLSNVTTPLLGLVDMAAVARIGGAVPIGAVSLGALVFSFVFWGFNFLRMATTGLTAQSVGAGDSHATAQHLGRALLIAAIAGGVLVIAQGPIAALAFSLLDGSPEVESLASGYVRIRLWSAPATLFNYSLLGWFIGLGRTRTALALQLILNVTNMVLDAVFVLLLGWGVDGVAAGSLLAEVVAAGVGLWLALRAVRQMGGALSWQSISDSASLRRTLGVNADIMIRSLSLISVFVWFTAQSAKHGDDILAANALLMQLVSIASYFLDGLAYAAETLTGQAIGARDVVRLRSAMVRSSQWALLAAVLLTGTYVFGGDLVIALLTPDEALRSLAATYLPWAAWVPLAGVTAFQLDGIFIGATRGPAMRNAMVVSLGIFAVAWWALRPWGNTGLWAALYVHYAARTTTLLVAMPALLSDATSRSSLSS
ncbi:MAG: MATE family efflux transporter [Myxococcales bacterium]|nr:MATE family efflux transporter [Myxococcales bacterium]